MKTLHGNTFARARRHERGLSLLEAAVTMAVIFILMTFVTRTLVDGSRDRCLAEERTLARLAIESALARIEVLPFEALLAEARALPGLRLAAFEVPGLSPKSARGTLHFVTDERLSDEDLPLAIGMPRDLDGDHRLSTADTTSSATLLPVIASVTWSGTAGEQRMSTVCLRHRPRSGR